MVGKLRGVRIGAGSAVYLSLFGWVYAGVKREVFRRTMKFPSLKGIE